MEWIIVGVISGIAIIDFVDIHAGGVGEAEGVGGAVGVGRERGVVGGLGVGSGEAAEDGIMPTGGVIMPAQSGKVAPAVADMCAVTHALRSEELHRQPRGIKHCALSYRTPVVQDRTHTAQAVAHVPQMRKRPPTIRCSSAALCGSVGVYVNFTMWHGGVRGWVIGYESEDCMAFLSIGKCTLFFR